jgi:sporulation protein YlmC with PRC-barrel domain
MIRNDQIGGLAGADVYSSDGDKIGTAGEVYLDYLTGRIEWISVRTGRFGLKESLVPLSEAAVVNDRIEIPFTKHQITASPPIDVDGDLGQAEVDELCAYYGLATADDGFSR